METDAHITEGTDATAIPAGLRSLWADACGWAAWLFQMFSAEKLRSGVNRTQGAKLSGWLRHVEASVRRLILAAALAMTPPERRAAATRTPTQTKQQAPCRASFRVFSLRGLGSAATKPRAAAPCERPYGHIPFPADPLLSLGAKPRPRRVKRSQRRRNPLDRWVRLSRQDPEWQPVERTTTYPAWDEDDDGIMSFVERIPAPARERKPRPPHDPDAMPASAWDWRRCRDEWQKLVPAPQLAARMEALSRVIADPTIAIRNSARRLHRSQGLARAAMRHAGPRQRYPSRAEHLQTGGPITECPERCHDELVRRDTS